MNIALIGPRGVGKSKTGRKLAKLSAMTLISTDMIAVYELGGISISEAIAQNGWKYFRNLETEILKKLSGAKNIILDCGGGILFDIDDTGTEYFSKPRTELLKSFCITINLTREKDYLISKVVGDGTRPVLSSTASYEEILERRLPYYEKAANYSVNIHDLNSEEAAEKIWKLLT
jgi:shikimate kinase